MNDFSKCLILIIKIRLQYRIIIYLVFKSCDITMYTRCSNLVL